MNEGRISEAVLSALRNIIAKGLFDGILKDARNGDISKEELHSAVWKTPGGSEGRTIDVHISTLRKKLCYRNLSNPRSLLRNQLPLII